MHQLVFVENSMMGDLALMHAHILETTKQVDSWKSLLGL